MTEPRRAPLDTELLGTAFRLAAGFHAGQMRKGSDTPYVAHLFGVTELVWTYGGSDVEAAAALLHDAAEDAGGQVLLERIERDCGPGVAAIVNACSDSLVDTRAGANKAGWLTRKTSYIARMTAPDLVSGALLVSACDKLNNLATTRRDYEAVGDTVWERFSTGWPGQLWYYQALLDVYLEAGDTRVRSVAARIRSELGALRKLLEDQGHDTSVLSITAHRPA